LWNRRTIFTLRRRARTDDGREGGIRSDYFNAALNSEDEGAEDDGAKDESKSTH
jgi:hypothetical protein